MTGRLKNVKPPLNPPAAWFDHPGEIPTDRRITITAEGRVYGYVTLWDVCHVGMDGCVKPPKGSPSDYGFAHQGETETAEGTMVATANIGGGAGHASMEAAVSHAADYYANTSTQLMRVKYGEDETGLWFSGSLWPDVDELEVARIRASAISGDWRFLGQWRQTSLGHDFVGSCLVNIPGFSMANAGELASQSGTAIPIAASGAIIQIDNTPSNVEEQMSCNCNAEPKCPCGEKPASECSGDCGKTAPVTAAVEAPVEEEAPEVEVEVEVPGEEVEAVEQPKLSDETANDVISNLAMKVDDVNARLTGIEEMLMQMYASKIASDLEK